MLPQENIPQPEPGGKEALDKYKSQLSLAHPGDPTMMAQMGGFDQNTTVRQLFESLGVDVDGSISQLTQFVEKQEELADPMNKMKVMAGQGQAPQQGQAPAPAPQQMPPSDPLGSLMR